MKKNGKVFEKVIFKINNKFCSQELWASKFHSDPLNVNADLRIPTMFIDPVVDIFVDPCEPTYRKPEQREKEKFVEWTQR